MIGFNGGLIGKDRTPAATMSLPGMWTLDENIKSQRNYSWPSPDSNFSSVSLLLHGDGTSGSTTFTDSSSSPKTMTAVGNAQINTTITDAFGRIQIGVLAFDGTGDRITTTSNSAFAFGTGDFTVEAWVRVSSRTSYPVVLEIGDHQGSTGILFIVSGGNNTVNNIGIYSGNFYGQLAFSATNTWAHIAWVRTSGSLKIYLNGIGNTAVTFTNNLTDTSTVTVGSIAAGGSSYDFAGQIDDLRVTKGVARYGSDFTPVLAPFPDF